MWPSARSGFQFFVSQDEVSDLEMHFIMVVWSYSLLLVCIVNLPYFDQDVLPRLWVYNYPSKCRILLDFRRNLFAVLLGYFINFANLTLLSCPSINMSCIFEKWWQFFLCISNGLLLYLLCYGRFSKENLRFRLEMM